MAAKTIDFDAFETRGVLAGAYRGADFERRMKTHLVFMRQGVDVATGCRQPLDNMADTYSASPEESRVRPTCKTCARKWDKLTVTPNVRRLATSTRIVKVLEVVDTRDYEEGPDGKFHPVPGSGTPSECSRCGRTHYVHATVQLDDETTALVGTGCMQQSEMTVTKKVKSAERAAKRVAALSAQYQAALQQHEEYEADWKEVSRLALPPIQESKEYVSWAKKELPVLTMGDVSQAMPYLSESGSNREFHVKGYRESLALAWRQQRMKERGWEGSVQYPHDIERALGRAESALERAYA